MSLEQAMVYTLVPDPADPTNPAKCKVEWSLRVVPGSSDSPSKIAELEQELGDVETTHGGRSLADVIVTLEKRIHALEVAGGATVVPPTVIDVTVAGRAQAVALGVPTGIVLNDGTEHRLLFSWKAGESSADFTGDPTATAMIEYPAGQNRGLLQVGNSRVISTQTMMDWADGDMVVTVQWNSNAARYQTVKVEHLSA